MEGGDSSEPERKRLQRRSSRSEALHDDVAEDGEGGGSKMVEEEKEEEELGEGRDPVEVLGRDIMTKVMRMLDARSVARSVVVSRKWQEIASADLIWRPKETTSCKFFEWVDNHYVQNFESLFQIDTVEEYQEKLMKKMIIMERELQEIRWLGERLEAMEVMLGNKIEAIKNYVVGFGLVLLVVAVMQVAFNV